MKPTEALPPEFVAVTVTVVAASSAEAGRLTAPDAASIVAPAPLTAKLKPAPVKAAAAATEPAAAPRVRVWSGSAPLATGAG